MKRKLKVSKIIICALMIIINIVSFNCLPDNIVINYSFNSQTNYAVSKALGLLICPIIVILLYFLEKSKLPKKGSDYIIFSIYVVFFFLNAFIIISNL